ncbi:hypothetical protein [Paraburkholderia silvatlantica]|uniref:Lipoprotein n=1 Tax=Paraburkholderia silvatlantica TaxID=321895 RepID=A0ABR6FP49_9BURK|nr:hypothetical protein [Paraburkholderia silvatlantica]MBB2929183.1 hypothetical protein [Paraburkholderia silvatlantica]PVY27215.1 hypothetical protein C7411_12028 [Paraburkholderia silvatlantica]PXW34244.1 hypothetical protein C7413_11928 [Paraburkholderia silvatlantica]TDQ85139.1 hypothetical protein C7412_12028 [Paraburkholderia silvatlantica]
MRIRLHNRASTTLSTAAIVVLATITLDACGPGYGSSAASSTPDTPESRSAATQSPLANSARITPLPTPDTNTSANTSANASTDTSTNPGAIPAYGANAATAANTASDPVQGAQASLAADSDQVTPVLSYAPGDSAQTQASNGNDSSSPATSSH